MTHPTRKLALKLGLLLLWASVSGGVVFFARDLQQVVAGWPLNFWLAAQGVLVFYIAVVAIYAWLRNRMDGDGDDARSPEDA